MKYTTRNRVCKHALVQRGGKYVPSYQNEIARKNKRFPRAKLGTAYRHWPRQVLRTATIPAILAGLYCPPQVPPVWRGCCALL